MSPLSCGDEGPSAWNLCIRVIRSGTKIVPEGKNLGVFGSSPGLSNTGDLLLCQGRRKRKLSYPEVLVLQISYPEETSAGDERRIVLCEGRGPASFVSELDDIDSLVRVYRVRLLRYVIAVRDEDLAKPSSKTAF